MIPSRSIRQLLAKNRFLNVIYLTDIGYYPKAGSHHRERKKGSPENIIFYCADGNGWYETEAGRFAVGRNQFFILPAGRWHRYGADPADPWTIYWLMFESNLADDIHLLQAMRYGQQPRDVAEPKMFLRLFNHITATLARGFTFENLVLANMDLWLLLTQTASAARAPEGNSHPTPVEKITAFMHENIQRKLSVAEMAAMVSYSASHLHTIFRSATGYAPLEYFIHLKMQHACGCLIDTSLRIHEIAAQVGYSDPYLFSRTFTRLHGMSPQKYRGMKRV